MPFIGALAAVGGSLLSGSMASDAAQSAANTSAAATEKSIEEQRRQFDLNRADQAPFIQTGTAANKRLAYLLGLNPDAAVTPKTAESLRQELLPKYLVHGAAGYTPEASQSESGADYGGFIRGLTRQTPSTPDFIDEAGLQAAIDAQLAQQAAPQPTPTDSDYGSLLKRFTQSDLEADPVYQNGLKFGLDQGTGAINARAIAGGGYDSGATLKALTRYATDYGSTKANESYNRFNNDQGTIYNRLAGVSGTGQQAVNQVGATGTQIANNISGLTQDAGSARAAGIVGGANAWGDALTGVGKAATNYSNQQWLNDLLKGRNTGMLRGSDYGL